MTKRKVFEFGGYAAAVILVAFGIATLVMGMNGRNTVNSSLKQEQITGTPDMTPTAIAGEVTAAKAAQQKLLASLQKAGVNMTPSSIETPSCSVANKQVNSGDRARCFAKYMRIHTFGSHLRPDVLPDGALCRPAEHASQAARTGSEPRIIRRRP